MTDIQHKVVAFVDQRELNVVRQALKATHDAINLKAELGLPALQETRQAVDELEAMVVSLKLALLRHHPDQMELPMDLPSTKEGEQKVSHQGDVAS